MTKAVPTAVRGRAAAKPASLTLAWLIDAMVEGELITRSSTKQLIEPPARKDGGIHHPLVVAAAQDWSDRRTPGRKLSLEVLTLAGSRSAPVCHMCALIRSSWMSLP